MQLHYVQNATALFLFQFIVTNGPKFLITIVALKTHSKECFFFIKILHTVHCHYIKAVIVSKVVYFLVLNACSDNKQAHKTSLYFKPMTC